MAGWHTPGSLNRPPPPRRPLRTTPSYILFSPPLVDPNVHNPFQTSTSAQIDSELSFQFPKSYIAASEPQTNEEKLYNMSRIEAMFQGGRRFRIVSMATGRALQILRNKVNGHFFLNARGALNVKPDQSCNSAWTVESKGNGRFQFHCNGSYLSVVDGYPTVTTLDMPSEAEALAQGRDMRRTWEVLMAEGHLYLKAVWAHEEVSSCLAPFLSASEKGELHPVGTCTTFQRATQFGVQLLPTLDMLRKDVNKNPEI